MVSAGCAGLAPRPPSATPTPSQACMMTITFLPFTVSHRGFRPHFHPRPSRPPLTPEHALLKLSDSWAVGLDHVVAEVSGSRPVPVTGRGWGWGWGDACLAPGAPGLLAELGSCLQVTHHLLTQQLLDLEGGPCCERSASQRVGVWGAFTSLKTFSFKGFKLQPKGSCGRDAPFPDGFTVAQAWPSGLAGALMLWVFLAAVFLDGDLPRGASGHLPVLHVCDCHRGRAGRMPPLPVSQGTAVAWARAPLRGRADRGLGPR